VETALKGKRFQEVEGIEINMTPELSAVIWRRLLTVFRNFLNYATNVFKWKEITLNTNNTIFYLIVYFVSFSTPVL
jgi:hypothetical protein